MPYKTAPKPISEKQIKFLNSLAEERVNGHLYVATQLAAWKVDSVEALSGQAATTISGVLLNEPKKAKASAGQALKAKATVEPGYYYEQASETVFQVVQAKTTGNTYAKRLVPPAPGKKKGSWEYAPGAMKQAGQWLRLTAEEAGVLGAKWGYCCVCGATLTDPKSIAAGIGPICAAKF